MIDMLEDYYRYVEQYYDMFPDAYAGEALPFIDWFNSL